MLHFLHLLGSPPPLRNPAKIHLEMNWLSEVSGFMLVYGEREGRGGSCRVRQAEMDRDSAESSIKCYILPSA